MVTISANKRHRWASMIEEISEIFGIWKVVPSFLDFESLLFYFILFLYLEYCFLVPNFHYDIWIF